MRFVFAFFSKSKKKRKAKFPRAFFFCVFQKRTLLGFDRAGRAAVFARAAINAYIGINSIAEAARSDRSYGAGLRASAASYAFFADFMCHNTYLPWDFVILLYHIFYRA